jgi:cyclopropane-fatty-acyl-phospholipid synthase
LEHVGPEHFVRLGRLIRRCLKPDGLGLIHTIARNDSEPLNRWIERNIFPGAQPPTLAQMMRIFEPFRFAVLDAENLRRHYALTLIHWLQRFENSVETVRRSFDDAFVRMWRMYLAASVAAFQTGALQLYQVLFSAADADSVPLTRADLYRERLRPDSRPLETS